MDGQTDKPSLAVANNICAPESHWRCFRGCAISSSHGRPQDFIPGWGQISGMQNDDFYSRHFQNTQVFTVTTNAQNTLKHFQGGGQHCPQNISFFSKGAPVFVERGGRLCHGTMASQSLMRAKM